MNIYDLLIYKVKRPIRITSAHLLPNLSQN